jgi:hypothetical protein
LTCNLAAGRAVARKSLKLSAPAISIASQAGCAVVAAADAMARVGDAAVKSAAKVAGVAVDGAAPKLILPLRCHEPH